jgi:hypothetical protein
MPFKESILEEEPVEPVDDGVNLNEDKGKSRRSS